MTPRNHPGPRLSSKPSQMASKLLGNLLRTARDEGRMAPRANIPFRPGTGLQMRTTGPVSGGRL